MTWQPGMRPRIVRTVRMPFVTTTDTAAAYVAGFEMGHLDAELTMIKSLGLVPGPKMLHAENQPQADLLAMKHGFTAQFEPVEGYEERIVCRFARAEVEPGETS